MLSSDVWHHSVQLACMSGLAIVVSLLDLSSRNEPVTQRFVYQLMHVCFIGYAIVHYFRPKISIFALGLILFSSGLLLEDQVSNYVRVFVVAAGMTALITKQHNETAPLLAVAAITLGMNKSDDVLMYVSILVLFYPMILFIETYKK